MPSHWSKLAQDSKVKVVKNWHHPIKDNEKLLKVINTVFDHEADGIENLIVKYRDELIVNLGKLDEIHCDDEFIAEAIKALGLISRKLNIIRTFSHLNAGSLQDRVIRAKEKIINYISSVKAMQAGVQRINNLIKNINGTNKNIALNELERQLQFFRSYANDNEDDNQQPHKFLFYHIYLTLTEFRSGISKIEVPCNSIELEIFRKKYTLNISLDNSSMEEKIIITDHKVFPDKKRKSSQISVSQNAISLKAEITAEEPKKQETNVWQDFNKIGIAIEKVKSKQILPEQLYDHLTNLTNHLLELEKCYSTIIQLGINRLNPELATDDELIKTLEDLLNSFKVKDINDVRDTCKELNGHLELVLNTINEEKEEAKENESVDEILCGDEAYNSVAELMCSVTDLEERLTDLTKLVEKAKTFVKNLQDQDSTAAQEEYVGLSSLIKSSDSETTTTLFCSSLITLCEKTLDNHLQNRTVLSC